MWKNQKATRKNKRGKASGGIIMGINKGENRIGKRDNDEKGENQERKMENYRSTRRKE